MLKFNRAEWRPLRATLRGYLAGLATLLRGSGTSAVAPARALELARILFGTISGVTSVRAALHPVHRRPIVSAGTFPVCVGDDLTDEDAFAVVASRGLGIRVGRARRRSNAVARLPSCAAVAAFLAGWRDACAPAAGPGATVAAPPRRRPRWQHARP